MIENPDWIQVLGFFSSLILPFFNIPLMVRIWKRKSAEDLSLIWVLGIFFSLLGMLPAGLHSPDPIFKFFSLLNWIFFSGVTVLAVYFRRWG